MDNRNLSLLTGSIPASISNTSNLHILNMAMNKLARNVHSLEKLKRLRFFSITKNLLEMEEQMT